MSKEKFTKGVWTSSREDSLEHSNYEVITIGDEGYCLVAHGVLEHDANLIAAAPEMYAAIEQCRKFYHKNGLEDLRNELDVLLAKARGEL